MSDNLLQISDFTYSYKDITKEKAYQSYITSKYEFSSLDPTIKYNGLFKHQEVIRRLILFVDKVLLFHKTGTGKSCAGFGSSEQFANDFLSLADDFAQNYISTNRSTIKRIYFLTKGPTLISNARRELVCSCIPDKSKYLTEEVLESSTDKIFRARLKREVSKYTEFDTYFKFASNISDDTTDQDIIDQYSNCMFICDEIQTLSSDDNDEGTLSEKKRAKSSKEKEENKKIYDTLHRVFHVAKNTKIILMTATPMIDKPKEIERPMNLILPLNKQMNFSDYSKLTIDDLKVYFHGNVSYVGDLKQEMGSVSLSPELQGSKLTPKEIKLVSEYSTVTKKYIEDTKKSGTKVIVYKDMISDYQRDVYIKVAEQEQGRFYSKERQILNITFPNENYDELPKFSDHVARLGSDRYAFKDKEITKSTLKYYAAKVDSIINECITGQGNRFVFSNFVKMGVFILAAGFKLYGLDQYLGSTSAFSSSKRIVSKYCGDSTDQQVKKIVIDKKLRFAIISTDTSPVQVDRIFELFNSYENRNGEYLKIIIGSPKTQIGISLMSVLAMHILDAHWNTSSRYQASSRGFRSGSLRYILSEGLKPMIFLHCAVMKSEKIPTIDQILYVRAEEKDIETKRIERIMKRLAIDCELNNVFNNGIDYSPICDYDLCNYTCAAKSETSLVTDYSSFDVLYSSELLDEIIVNIKDIFKSNFLISFTDLMDNLSDKYTVKQILLAVEKAYDAKSPIANRFGFDSYLQVKGDYLVIYNKYPEVEVSDEKLISMTNYSQINIFASVNNSLDDYLKISNTREIDRFTEKYQKVSSIPFDELSIEKQSLLLERVIVKSLSKKLNSFDEHVMNYYRKYVFHFNYPSNAISELKRFFENRKRKKIATHSKILDELNYHGNENVILNTLLANSTDRASYRVTVKTISKELRILNIDNVEKKLSSGFRDADTFETIAFNHMLLQREENSHLLKDEKVYGMISHADNNFRIFYDDRSSDQRVREERDSRTKLRGRKCMTYSVPKLISILIELGIGNDELSRQKVTLNKSELVNYLLSKDVPDDMIASANIDYLKTFYNWLTKKSKEEICVAIQNKLQQKGLIIVS